MKKTMGASNCRCPPSCCIDFDQEFTICQSCFENDFDEYCFYYWVKLFLWQEQLSKKIKLHFRPKHIQLSNPEYKLQLSNKQVKIFVSKVSIYIQVLSEAQIEPRCHPVISN